MACYSPLKGFKDPHTGGLCFDRTGTKETLEVACGQCIGCRTDWACHWAMRIVHEASMHEYTGGNCFVTLTYRDRIECDERQWLMGQHVPDDWSLNARHLELFWKRLRKYIEPRKIKYFVAGEYGRRCKHGIDVDIVRCPLCNVGRPHYHAVIFNYFFDDLEPYQSDGEIIRYTSPTLERIWGYGFVDVNELNFSTASYVARYVLKKVMGILADDWYTTVDLNGELTFIRPEFVRMSRGARKGARGLGYDWFEKFETDVFPSDEVPIPGFGIRKGVPRYYEEIFKEKYPEMWEEIRAVRQEFIKAHREDFTPQRLMDRYKVHLAKNRTLKRDKN